MTSSVRPHTSKLIFASVAAISLIVLSACNTVQGMGEDLSKAGEAIGTSAKKTKEKM